jgi:predicted ABC-type exoprotein transport system permease subunit
VRVRSMLVLVAAGLAALFVVLNWRVFAGPAKLNLLLTSAEIPVGVVMLLLFALALLVLWIIVGRWQGTLLVEFRRQAQELQAQRLLAENAEASRFTELGALIREEIAKLRTELQETEHSIAATLGEMDDRLRKPGQGI